MNGPRPVEDGYPLSVARGTIDPKGTTRKSTPAGAGTPHGRGLAESKGHDRLMHSVEPTSDTPPPACPACGRPASASSVRNDSPNIRIGDYRCPAGDIWTTRWLVA